VPFNGYDQQSKTFEYISRSGRDQYGAEVGSRLACNWPHGTHRQGYLMGFSNLFAGLCLIAMIKKALAVMVRAPLALPVAC